MFRQHIFSLPLIIKKMCKIDLREKEKRVSLLQHVQACTKKITLAPKTDQNAPQQFISWWEVSNIFIVINNISCFTLCGLFFSTIPSLSASTSREISGRQAHLAYHIVLLHVSCKGSSTVQLLLQWSLFQCKIMFRLWSYF